MTWSKMFRSHLDEVWFLTRSVFFCVCEWLKNRKENCSKAMYFWHLITENEVHCVDTNIDEINARWKLKRTSDVMDSFSSNS